MINFIIKTDDYSLAEEKINSISKSMDNPEIIIYDLDEDNAYNLIDEISTISLFDNPKLVILKSGNDLLSQSDEKISELVSQMADSSNSNVLVIVDSEFDIKTSDRFNKYSLIKKYAQEFDLKVKNMNFDEYALKSFKEEDYQINDDALNLLINSSQSLTMLKRNIDILKCYKLEDKLIKKEDVELMISKPLDDDVYAITNAVLKHDKRLAFELYKGFKLQNIKTPYLISLLLNKFQELYNVYILARNNVKQEDIANIFNVKPGRAYYMLKDSKSQSLESIKSNLDYLFNLDYNMKSGKIDDELGLQLFFLR